MGLGRSADWRWNAYGIHKPTLQGMADMAVILKQLWSGKAVSYNGLAGNFPNLKLSQLIDLPPPKLYLAAIGPETLAMAGRYYDGVILHPFVSLEGARRSVNIVRQAAIEAGRDPDAIEIIATLVAAPNCTLAEEESIIRVRAAGYFQIKGLGDMLVHINGWNTTSLEKYRNNPLISTLNAHSAEKMLSREDLATLSYSLPEEWITTASAKGSRLEVLKTISDYIDVGIDEIIIHGCSIDKAIELIESQ
jgi:probable F420-dependent oxidoreductase